MNAGEELHAFQTSISEQIKELEAVLGEPLFRLNGRSKVLADAGQIVLRYAEEILVLAPS